MKLLRLLLVLSLLFVPAISFAQEAERNGPAVGTLVAASLETAGYESLEIVLRDLKDFFSSFAALIYFASILWGISVIAHNGKFDVGLWFIVGPAVFYLLIGAKVNAGGAEWQFGSDKQTGRVQEYLNREVTAEVPLVFHEYNVLVSRVIQELIKVFSNDDPAVRVKFTQSQKITDELMKEDIGSPGLAALSKHIISECNESVKEARRVALGEVGPSYQQSPEQRSAASALEIEYKQKRIPYPDGEAERYVRNIMANYLPSGGLVVSEDPSSNTNFLGKFQECLQNTVYESGTRDIFYFRNGGTCEAYFCMLGIGTYSEAKAALAKQTKNLELTASEAQIREIYSEIAKKLSNKTDPASAEDIEFIVAGHMLRKAMRDDQRSQDVSTLAKHWNHASRNEGFSTNMNDAQVQGYGQSLLQEIYGASQQGTLYSIAMLMPYVQGILLYGFAITYPFFAFYVLVPGRAGTLLSWMALWAWVKSWDVGWTMVMLADSLLGGFLPSAGAAKPGTDPFLIEAMKVAFNGDTAYSTANYYNIIGLLIVSVPVVMAQLVMGGKRAINGLMLEGIQKFGTSLGGAAGDYVALKHLRAIDWEREQGAANYVKSKFGKNTSESIAKERKFHESARSKGNAAYLAGGALVVGAVAATILTGGAGAIVFAAVGVAGATIGLSGLNAARTANNNLVAIETKNAQNALWEYSQGNEFRSLNNLRAMLSNRGEFFVLPDYPYMMETQLKNLHEKSKGGYGKEAAYGAAKSATQATGVFGAGRGVL